MLGKDILENITEWDHSKQRATFLSFSAGFRILIQHVRKKHKLANKIKEFNRTPHTYDFMTFVRFARIAYPEINQDVKELSLFFHMSDLFIGDALRGLKNLHLAETWIVRMASSDEPLLEEGFYIRVDPAIPFSSVREAYDTIKHLYTQLKPDKPKIIHVRWKKERKLESLSDRLKMFEHIETFVFKDYQRKGMIDSSQEDSDQGEDVEKIYNPLSLVLEGIKDYKDVLEEAGQTAPNVATLRSRYYEIYSYYSLPSYQDCRNFLIKTLLGQNSR